LVLAGRYHPTMRLRKMGTQPILQTYFAPKPKNATRSRTRRHLITCDRSPKPLTENTARQTTLNFNKLLTTTTIEPPADTGLPIWWLFPANGQNTVVYGILRQLWYGKLSLHPGRIRTGTGMCYSGLVVWVILS
jgi:hypothetical protein